MFLHHFVKYSTHLWFVSFLLSGKRFHDRWPRFVFFCNFCFFFVFLSLLLLINSVYICVYTIPFHSFIFIFCFSVRDHCHRQRSEGVDVTARRKLLIASGLCLLFMICEIAGKYTGNLTNFYREFSLTFFINFRTT